MREDPHLTSESQNVEAYARPGEGLEHGPLAAHIEVPSSAWPVTCIRGASLAPDPKLTLWGSGIRNEAAISQARRIRGDDCDRLGGTGLAFPPSSRASSTGVCKPH